MGAIFVTNTVWVSVGVGAKSGPLRSIHQLNFGQTKQVFFCDSFFIKFVETQFLSPKPTFSFLTH